MTPTHRALLFFLAATPALAAAVPSEWPELREYPSLAGTQWRVHAESYRYDWGTVHSPSAWRRHEWTFTRTRAAVDLLYGERDQVQHWWEYRLDASQSPMWLDLIVGDEVQLGSLRIDGGRLTWVRGQRVTLADWRRNQGHFPERPWRFDLDPHGGGTVLVEMERSREMP